MKELEKTVNYKNNDLEHSLKSAYASSLKDENFNIKSIFCTILTNCYKVSSKKIIRLNK